MIDQYHVSFTCEDRHGWVMGHNKKYNDMFKSGGVVTEKRKKRV